MITKIASEKRIYAMGPKNPPALEVEPGSTVLFEVQDCFSNQITKKEDLFNSVGWNTINPATGPLAVKGCEPGDTLVVDIVSIRIAEQGVMVCVPGMGALGDLIKETETKILPVYTDSIKFNDKIDLPVLPMIGVIGTAPEDEDIPCGTPGHHGGNMDTRYISAGSRLYLPVYVKGGNLALGDLHAVMGDGEVSICGVEISGEVIVTVNLIKNNQLDWPVLETDHDWYIIASAETLDTAAEFAIEATANFLVTRTGLSINDISCLLSTIAHLEICQVVDPLKMVRVRLPKKVFEPYNLTF